MRAFPALIDFVTRIGLFTWVILAHNVFAATQDVAIDALTPEQEAYLQRWRR